MNIPIQNQAGEFAENKDLAADLRENRILPAIRSGEELILDFTGVEGATQSFIHALISKPIRDFGEEALSFLTFKGCNPLIEGIVGAVVQYTLEAIEDPASTAA